MAEERTKLKKRIQHWVEHNDEHTVKFQESAETAIKLGLTEAAEALIAAVKAGRLVSDELRKAESNIC
jgi:hypothetical protein